MVLERERKIEIEREREKTEYMCGCVCFISNIKDIRIYDSQIN